MAEVVRHDGNNVNVITLSGEVRPLVCYAISLDTLLSHPSRSFLLTNSPFKEQNHRQDEHRVR